MGKQYSVAAYVLKLMAGSLDATKLLDSVLIKTSRKYPIQFFEINIRMNRETFDASIVPNKSKLSLEIVSYRGISRDEGVDPLSPILKVPLCLLYENSSQTTSPAPNDESASGIVTLVCIPLDMIKKQQKFIKDKVFIDKTREEILNEVLEGVEFENHSEIYNKSEKIEQVVLPPLRQYMAIEYLHERIKLFEGQNPIFTNYCFLDKKLHIGSCDKNNFDPVRALFVSESGMGPNESIAKGALIANKIPDRAGEYTIDKAIKETINYSDICMALGMKHTYVYSPQNNLFSRVKIDLGDETNKLENLNFYGAKTEIGEHIKEMNNKETWYNSHNGLFEVDDDKANKIFANAFITEQLQKSIEIEFYVEGSIIFSDFLYPGKRIEIVCGENALRFKGKYIIEETTMIFKYDKMYWSGSCTVKAYSGIQAENLK